MIALMFSFGTETILVVIKGHDVTFGNTLYGAQMAPLSGLRLSRAGVEKEWPDLIGKENWREEALNRYKLHIKSLDSEEAIAQYVISELRKVGYKPMYKQLQGHRKESIQ